MDATIDVVSPTGRRRDAKKMIYVVRGRPGREDRGALPAGHRLSWGLLTDGTVLQDAPYPFPVFGP